jgi:hypothetical protein
MKVYGGLDVQIHVFLTSALVGMNGQLHSPAATTLRSVCRLLVTANVIPSSSILLILMMEELSSSETSILTRAIWRNISEDAILHSHRHENLKFYIVSHLPEFPFSFLAFPSKFCKHLSWPQACYNPCQSPVNENGVQNLKSHYIIVQTVVRRYILKSGRKKN